MRSKEIDTTLNLNGALTQLLNFRGKLNENAEDKDETKYARYTG